MPAALPLAGEGANVQGAGGDLYGGARRRNLGILAAAGDRARGSMERLLGFVALAASAADRAPAPGASRSGPLRALRVGRVLRRCRAAAFRAARGSVCVVELVLYVPLREVVALV